MCICICHFASLSHIILQILSITQEYELVYHSDKEIYLTINYNEIRLIYSRMNKTKFCVPILQITQRLKCILCTFVHYISSNTYYLVILLLPKYIPKNLSLLKKPCYVSCLSIIFSVENICRKHVLEFSICD